MKKNKTKISDIIDALNLKIECGEKLLDREIKGGYASDLLSDVMANTKEGDIWVTLQGHPNIVAVAKLKEIAGIILVNNRRPEEETIKKAEAEEVPIMTSALPSFELIGKLHEMGISGMR
jgi:serine kinase of HPr protein (carbohydrate metabolism regulator)